MRIIKKKVKDLNLFQMYEKTPTNMAFGLTLGSGLILVPASCILNIKENT